MKYGEVEGVNKPVSRLALGTMIVTTQDRERSERLLDDAMSVGINTFDCAHVYAGGNSERALGPWVNQRGLRDKVVILTKGCHPNQDRQRVTPFDIAADLHDSLARLQCEYVDIYLLHRDDPLVPVGPIVEALNEQVHAGKIRAFGGSNWTHQRIQEANDYAQSHGLIPFAASSPNFGLAEQIENPWGEGCVSLAGPRNAPSRAWYRERQLPIFAYSSLARGLFSGRVDRENFREICDGACQKAYCHEVNFQRLERVRELARERGLSVPQIALATLFHHDLNVFALVGATSEKECEADAASLDIALSEDEMAWLDLRERN